VYTDLVSLSLSPPPHHPGRISPASLSLSLSLPVLSTPKTKWADVGGAVEAKRALIEAAVWPLTRAPLFLSLGISPPRGVLLFGPPGTGKTLVAAALAAEAGLRLIAVKGPELLSKWVGESERAVRGLFRAARAAAPCVVFFDELDALGAARGGEGEGGGGGGSSGAAARVVSQLLVELDGAEPLGRVVVGATNRPDLIDPALLRPGRFDAKVYLGPPNEKARGEILGGLLKKIPAVGRDIEVDVLAAESAGLTGAELAAAVRSASLAALRSGSRTVDHVHVSAAIQAALPGQITPEMLAFYEGLR
jgi:SpoVK/Ycf46/Vps4 family AAA+-type ATPase